jgi:prepilin-type processing-associated H-X9-DG protein
MPTIRQRLQGLCLLLVVSVAGTGCTSDAAVQRLSLPEQAEFFLHRNVMTWAQECVYLVKTTAAARTAYLQEIGLAKRFQALDPLDQETVRHGWPRRGMSADALLFLWGEPSSTAGDARRSAHWYDLGSSLELATYDNQYRHGGNRVDVSLVDGHVVGWVDDVPNDAESARGCRW